MRMRSRWLVLLGCVGFAGFWWLIWAIQHTPRPSLPIVIALMLTVVAAVVGPWMVLAAFRLTGEPAARQLFWRVVVVVALVAVGGTAAALIVSG